MRNLLAPATLALIAFAGAVRAEVVDSQPTGFTVRQSVTINAPAAKVWQGLVHIGAWWDPSHSYSGDTHNFAMDLRPGGAWVESLPGGGGVQHMVVVYSQPFQTLRLEGALGPLQSYGVAGHLTWTLKEAGGVTTLTQTYDAGGHATGGLDKLAGGVDRVPGEQAARLKSYVETGKP